MGFDPSRVRLVCFDVDGTLSDTDELYIQRIQPWIAPLGRLIGTDVHQLARKLVYTLETPGNFILEWLDKLGMDRAVDRLSGAVDRWRILPRKPFYLLIEGVDQMLDQLQSGYQLAIVSSRGSRKTMAFLHYFNLVHFFDLVVTSQTCRRTKPHPDPLLWVAQQTAIPVENILMVGDTSHDIRAGKAAGTQTIGVLCGFGSEKGLRKAGADLILVKTTELSTILT